MIIAVAGGKGGVGKTFLSSSLALSAAPLQFLDCDVEEPNAHIFLDFSLKKSSPVTIDIPSYQKWKGEVCEEAARFCRTKALAVVNDRMLVFPELCTGCGGCFRICPEGVLQPIPHVVGKVNHGSGKRGISLIYGELEVGEQRTEKVVREVKAALDPEKDVVIDAPPGNARAAMETISGSDFCVLVTEPTPFGLKDLRGNKKLADLLSIPVGVIINRSGSGYRKVEEWCSDQGVPVLARVPFDPETARGGARGFTLQEIDRSWEDKLQSLWEEIKTIAG